MADTTHPQVTTGYTYNVDALPPSTHQHGVLVLSSPVGAIRAARIKIKTDRR